MSRNHDIENGVRQCPQITTGASAFHSVAFRADGALPSRVLLVERAAAAEIMELVEAQTDPPHRSVQRAA